MRPSPVASELGGRPLTLVLFSKSYLCHAPPQQLHSSASRAQQLLLDFTQGDEMPGASHRLSDACVSSFTGVCSPTKSRESKGVDSVNPQVCQCSQSIQRRIKRSGLLPFRLPQLLSPAMSEDSEFVIRVQVRVEVDIASSLGQDRAKPVCVLHVYPLLSCPGLPVPGIQS
jgi:hypothetical protein